MLNPRQLFNVIARYADPGSSSLAFWWLPLREGCGSYRLSASSPCDYYLDFSAKAAYHLHLDQAGVIQLDYKGDIGVRYNPCAVAQFGLGHFALYLKERDPVHLERALRQGEWLVAHLVPDRQGRGRWEYHFGNEGFPDITLPFISAIAQGQGISLLLRLHAATGRDCFRQAADAAFGTFLARVPEGGVTAVDAKGRLFLEELPTGKVSCVLDGFMYAMFGVYDYCQVTGSAQAREIFDQSVATLREILPDFDLGYWSRADCLLERYRIPASFFYHNVHIQQLKALHLLTGEETFARYARRWERYQGSRVCRGLALASKAVSKILFY